MNPTRGDASELVVRGASDLHGFLPTVEPCDVLLLAGDLVPLEIQEDFELSLQWFSYVFAKWLEEVPAGEVVAIAGNHDFLLARHRHIGPGVHDGLFDAGYLSARRWDDPGVRADGLGNTLVTRNMRLGVHGPRPRTRRILQRDSLGT